MLRLNNIKQWIAWDPSEWCSVRQRLKDTENTDKDSAAGPPWHEVFTTQKHKQNIDKD